MALDSTLIQSDILSRVVTAAQKKYVKDNLPVIDRKDRPYLDLCEAIDQPTSATGDGGAISDAMKTTPALGGQWWSMTDTIQNPVDVNNTIRIETTYTRFVTPIQIWHDEMLQRGYRVEPHSSKPFEARVKQLGEEGLLKLRDQISDIMETHNESHEVSLDLALHRQGASVKEPLGLNGHLPLAPTGNWLGHNRQDRLEVQHIVQASTVGSSGTMVNDISTLLRQLKMRSARSRLKGEWYLLAGGQWIDDYRNECVRLGIQRNTEASGVAKLDSVILDDALRVGGLKPIWDPTLDNMDVVASSERGVGASPAAVTFSGGGSPTAQAIGYAVTNGAGVITQIVITSRGAGYTSAPTVAVAGGSGATFQAKIFSTSSGAAFTTVAADDARLGQLDTVAVNAGGTGFANGDIVNFTRRAYWLFKPALKYRTIMGIKRNVTSPADSRDKRKTELQLETGLYHYVRAPRLMALHYTK